MRLLICLTLLCASISFSLQAQTNVDPAKAQQIRTAVENARADIKKRGLSETAVIAMMKERGIDLNDPNIINADPAQIQKVYEQVADELEGQKNDSSSTTEIRQEIENQADDALEEAAEEVAGDIAEEVAERVQDGASVEEAIAEELTEEVQEELPPPRIYGHQIFREGQIEATTNIKDARPPSNYILGTGDQIAVSIFGSSVFNFKYEINEDGFITPSNMRPIFLKGLALDKSKEIVRRSFQERFRFAPDQFELTVDIARTIALRVVGEVFSPGTKTISAENTAIEALAAAGGPTDIGSVRNIIISKPDGTSKTLDIYEYLQNPSSAYDYFLEQNDIVLVPLANKIINLQGAVRRPFRYELLKGENLNKLIEYAGGLNANAYRSNIQIKRFENDRERIINVNLRELAENNRDFVLYDSDVITVKTIPSAFKNYISISGAVELPDRYELVDSMRIVEAINKAVLEREARTDAVIVKRKRTDETSQYLRIDLSEALDNPASPSNILLQPEDSISVFLQSKYVDFGTVSITGAVRDAITFPFDISENLKIEDAILLAGGLDPEANNYAYLYRKNRTNFEDVDYIRLNIREIMDNPSSSQNIPLMPYDSIAILSNPTFTDEFSIQVQGLVRNAGSFKYDETLTLKDALTLAGGLQIGAAANQIDLFRLNIAEDATQTMVAQLEVNEDLEVVTGADFPLEPFDLIVVRRKPDFELFETIVLEGEIKYPGPYALLDDNERILSLVERAGGLTEEAFPEGASLYRSQDNKGYIVFELTDALLNKNSRSNLILKEGDTLFIPKQKDLIGITGATRAPELYPDRLLASNGQLNVPYHAGKRARFYINEYAVGISENGKRSLVTVEQPNGRIARTVDLGLVKIYPKVEKGAVINVGVKPPKEEEELIEEREPVDWGQVVKDTLAQVTTVISLILLIDRI